MLANIKRFFKIYPLPIFVLLLVFAIYYSIFEVLKKQDLKSAKPLTEAELMQNETPKQTTATQSTQTQESQKSPQAKSQESPNLTPQPTQPTRLAEPTQTPLSTEGKKSLITAKVASLNIRQEPSTTSAIIGKLTPKIQAVILEDNGEWVLIGASQNAKALGWVLKSYTKTLPQRIIAQEMEEIKIDLPQFFTSQVPRLNIRQEPSTQAQILGILTPEDSVEILERAGEWVKIQDINPSSSKSGWVMRRFLKEI